MTNFSGNAPVSNNNYSIASGANSNSVFITTFNTRDPGSQDIQWQISQRWVNTINTREWILRSFTTILNVTTANWIQLSNGDALIDIAVPNGSSPISPDANGLINFTSTNSSVVITGSAGGLGAQNINFSTAISNAIDSVNIQTFTSSATYTPTAGMKYCIVQVVGGGGGGGGAAATTSSSAPSGGGGAGEYSTGVFNSTDIGINISIIVGTGGAGGLAGNNDGTTGATSSIGSLITSIGGSGGSGSDASGFSRFISGGSGGTGGTGGSYRFSGGYGGNGFFSGSDQIGYGGFGGSSIFSPGAILNLIGGSSGTTGFLYGGGGSGAYNDANKSASSGGDGAPGIVVITEYISI